MIRANNTRGYPQKILILCEDKKSFRFYIGKICYKLGYEGSIKKTKFLYNAKGTHNIYVEKADGTDPLSIVEEAERRIRDYDIIYCVFDEDGHVDGRLEKYKEAMSTRIKNIKKINSVICYEFWLLSHFKKTSKQFKNPDELIKYLNKTIRETTQYKKFKYDKADLFERKFKNKISFFDTLFNNMELAKQRVALINKDNKKIKSDNPSTQISKLIEDLESWVDE